MKYYGEPEKRWNSVLYKLRAHPYLWGEDDAKSARVGRIIGKVRQHVRKWEEGRIGAWCVYVDSQAACNVLSRHYRRRDAEQAMRKMVRCRPKASHRFFVSWRPASKDVHPHPLRGRIITPPLD